VPAGSQGWITQALGQTYTVQIPHLGGLFRISGKDADALGLSPASESGDPTGKSHGPAGEDAVWNALREVYDPEIPVNVVDLGLIYDLSIESLPTGGSRVEVKMTLTARGCGMGPSIAMDAKSRIEGLPGVDEAAVDVVWDPPWNPRMISPEGRTKLGIE
jgi:probable FeS assembly SUF system protein SufT